MTVPKSSFEIYHSFEWVDPIQPSHHPSKRHRTLEHVVTRVVASNLPGSEHVISHLHDKYRRNLSVNTIRQTGETLIAFLLFFQSAGKLNIKEICRKDVAAYVEYEQNRGLKITSVRNHLQTVYAFMGHLVDKRILPPEILHKKIKLNLPEELPRAIPCEDLQQLLSVINDVRDRTLLLLLLQTGMRIGELLNVKVPDIILPERKIILYLGEKNYQGRVVYYSDAAEQALNNWLATRNPARKYLFYGRRNSKLCYARAWGVMREALQNAGLEHKGYSLHSLRHTFATNMLNAGMRLEVLQQLLGHLSIEVTLRYAKVSDVTRENEFFRAMATIENGEIHEHDRVNPELQAVFEKKKLLGAHD